MILWERGCWFSIPGQFLLASVFCWILRKWFDITLLNLYHNRQSLPPNNSTNSLFVGTIKKRGKEAKRDKKKIGVGTLVTVKVIDIGENIREGERRSTRKELVGLYYLAHIAYVIFLYHFWLLVPVFYMVYIWRTTVEVSSETPIYVLTILFQLSVSPPSSCPLMMVWKILNSSLSM